LFASYFLGQLMGFLAYGRLYRSIIDRPSSMAPRRLLAVARYHRRFPLFTLPAELLGTLSLPMPVLALSALGAAPVLGAYSRARQVVSMPGELLGSSIAQVFRQRASEQFHRRGSCERVYVRTFTVLAAAGLPPTLVLILFAPDLFRIYLGPNWIEAGDLARILAPMIYLGFICS